MNIEGEIWKTCEGLPLHEVSSLGRIRTIDSVVTPKNGKQWIRKGIIKKLYLAPNGYYSFSVMKPERNSGKININVHAAVARAFVPNPHGKPVVNHKNGIKTDNAPDNLDWVTYQENPIHARDVLKNLRPRKGEDVPLGQRRLDNDSVRIILAAAPTVDYRILAKVFGVSRWTISQIATRRKWKHICPELLPIKKSKCSPKTLYSSAMVKLGPT